MDREHFFGEITLPRREFIKEHKKLIKILTHGTKADRLKEAAEQAAELKNETGGSKHLRFRL
jgi:hypothetical protein